MMMNCSWLLSWHYFLLSHLVWFLLSVTPSGVRILFFTLVSFLIVFTIRIPSVISSGWNFHIIHMFIQIFWMKAPVRLFFPRIFPWGRINSGIESSSCDSVNKNKRFVGGNPCLSNFIFLFFLFLTNNVRRGYLFYSCVLWLFVMFVQDCPRLMMTLVLIIFSPLEFHSSMLLEILYPKSYRLTFSMA